MNGAEALRLFLTLALLPVFLSFQRAIFKSVLNICRHDCVQACFSAAAQSRSFSVARLPQDTCGKGVTLDPCLITIPASNLWESERDK